MALIRCEECKSEISDKAKQCPNCGFIKKEKIVCTECYFENEIKGKHCIKCGAPLKQSNQIDWNKKINIPSKSIFIFIIIVVIVGACLGIGLHVKKLNDIKIQEEEQKRLAEEQKRLEEEEYNNRPIKVDISMTSYYGTIEYILYELGLDFDLVTMGANCYTGVQRNEFKTEKYGILHTEFRFCKSNSTTIFRVYNDEKDQSLREPRAGELPYFDDYGKRTNSSNGTSSL